MRTHPIGSRIPQSFAQQTSHAMDRTHHKEPALPTDCPICGKRMDGDKGIMRQVPLHGIGATGNFTALLHAPCHKEC